jgi:hypothetical protein
VQLIENSPQVRNLRVQIIKRRKMLKNWVPYLLFVAVSLLQPMEAQAAGEGSQEPSGPDRLASRENQQLSSLFLNGDFDRLYETAYLKAQLGDAEAQYFLGLFYWNGRKVDFNAYAAFAWLQIAYANDHKEAEELIIETSQFITPRKQKDLLQQAANCIDSNYFSCDFK